MFFLLINVKFPHVRIEQFTITYNQIIAALIFIIAASTDSLDGYIARKRKLVTNLASFWTRLPTSCSYPPYSSLWSRWINWTPGLRL